MSIKQKINDYTDIFEQLRGKLRWRVTDKRILMSIASLYVMNNREFHLDRFLQAADAIKNQAGLFSSMKSYPRYTTAAMLDVNFEAPEHQVSPFFSLYDDFIEAKFRRGNFTYLAASVLLTKKVDTKDYKAIISRAKDIYEGMKKEHAFLTTANDYPLATLLALENGDDIIQHIEHFYEKLNQSGFRKGNDLQFLSHILSLSDEESTDILVSRAIRVFDAFKEIGVRQKSAYYPLMGMLALLPAEELDMAAIEQLYNQLNNERHFRWQKDMNMMLAVSFFVSERIEQSGLAETSIYTTMETILQAQQAVMTATMAGAAAASASSSSN